MYCRFLDTKDWNEYLVVIKKALHERGLIDTTFNDVSFTQQAKNMLTHNQHKVIGLFVEDELVGLCICELHTFPWANASTCTFDLIHTEVNYRDRDHVQLMFDYAYDQFKPFNITHYKFTFTNLLLDEQEKNSLLLDNNFIMTNTIWEKVN